MSWVKTLRKKTKRYYQPLIGAAAWVGFYLCRAIPLAVERPLARLAGRLCFYLMPDQRARSLAHLELAFGGEKSARERRAIARASFQHLLLNFVEWTHMTGLSLERARGSIRIRGVEHLEHALGNGGVVVLSPHLGNWELIAVAITLFVRGGAVVARRSRYPAIDRLTERMRLSNRIATIYRHQGVRPILRVLRSGNIVGTLIDQDIDKVEGAFAPFFGRLAFTPTAILAVARMAGASVVPVAIRREGAQHHIQIEPPLVLSKEGDAEEDARRVNAVTERQVRACPEQWVWMHERWKRQALSTAGTEVT